MTKSELRKLICERFGKEDLDNLMFDFCEKHPEVKYFGHVYGSYESQVSQLLLSLNDNLILKLEQFIYLQRPDISNTKPSVLSAMEVRDAIVNKYKEQQLFNALFGFYNGFDWDKDIPSHLNYTSKAQEIVKFFMRRNMLPELVKWLKL